LAGKLTRGTWIGLAVFGVLAVIYGCGGVLFGTMIGAYAIAHGQMDAQRQEALEARDRAQAEAAEEQARAEQARRDAQRLRQESPIQPEADPR
jgi:hypothetical protein